MPTPRLGHGAPSLADGTEWTRQPADRAGGVTRPSTVLVLSARWENAPPTVGATTDGVPLTYGFRGSPQRYYGVTYAAPGTTAPAQGPSGGHRTPARRRVCRYRLEHFPP